MHSLARLLARYEGVQLRYVAVTKDLGMPDDVREFVEKAGTRQDDFDVLEEAVADADVLYVTR